MNSKTEKDIHNNETFIIPTSVIDVPKKDNKRKLRKSKKKDVYMSKKRKKSMEAQETIKKKPFIVTRCLDFTLKCMCKVLFAPASILSLVANILPFRIRKSSILTTDVSNQNKTLSRRKKSLSHKLETENEDNGTIKSKSGSSNTHNIMKSSTLVQQSKTVNFPDHKLSNEKSNLFRENSKSLLSEEDAQLELILSHINDLLRLAILSNSKPQRQILINRANILLRKTFSNFTDEIDAIKTCNSNNDTFESFPTN